MKFAPLVRVVGGVATAGLLVVSAGVASADSSVLDPLVNTTCSYAQITAALKAEAPDLSSLLNGRPQAQTRLQQFLALPVDQRQQHLDQQLAANPMAESMIEAQLGSSDGQEAIDVANTCNRY
ncbi:hemophore-related protein [soil metagenome]